MTLLYGVVVCSRCHRAKGVRLKQKTTECQCGHIINVSTTKVKAKTSDARELVGAVALENAGLRKGIEEYERMLAPSRKRRTVRSRIAEVAAKAGSREQRIKAVATELTKQMKLFSANDFVAVLDILNMPDPQSRLEELLTTNFIYEPRPGLYRTV